jgi:phosphoglycerol transferase MdoB-like AlkP superfamily enzyme
MKKYLLLPWLWQVIFHLALFTIFRVIFYCYFDGSQEITPELIQSFYLGAKFDLRAYFFVFGVTLIPLIFPKLYRSFSPLFRPIFSFIYFVIMATTIFVYFVDFGHYDYLQTRVNISALEFLQNPIISITMVWQTYPVIPAIIAMLLLSFLGLKVYQKSLKRVESFTKSQTNHRWLTALLLLIFSALLSYGKISHYPLRWSEAFFSPKPFISELTQNPLLSVINTITYRNVPYETAVVQQYYPVVAPFLGIQDINQEKTTALDFTREFAATGTNNPNIVIILMESMAANKSSLFNNPLDPTPELKKIATEGVFFKKFFTPTEATARGIFATMISTPDVTNQKSSSRNPLIVDQQTLFNQLTGYERFYFLGGSANWGNIRALFSHNIEGIHIFEEGSYKSPRVDVWGISDLDLFKESHEVLQKQTRPFVAFVQTAGFHRPYTIPGLKGAFEVRNDISKEELANYGFESIEQYNSIRFQDYALGEFFKLAKSSPYYANTIFAILGDHGLPAKKSLNMLPGYYQHRLVHHHVPFVIIAPKLAPKVEEKIIGSQVDVIPTAVSLAGQAYQIKTMGRNLFAPRTAEQNFAFLFSWQYNPYYIGLIGEEFYFENKPSKKGLFRYESEEPLKDLSIEFPEERKKMEELTQGLYESAQYMLYHNPKKTIPSQ